MQTIEGGQRLQDRRVMKALRLSAGELDAVTLALHDAWRAAYNRGDQDKTQQLDSILDRIAATDEGEKE